MEIGHALSAVKIIKTLGKSYSVQYTIHGDDLFFKECRDILKLWYKN